jgi:hypothetical protein
LLGITAEAATESGGVVTGSCGVATGDTAEETREKPSSLARDTTEAEEVVRGVRTGVQVAVLVGVAEAGSKTGQAGSEGTVELGVGAAEMSGLTTALVEAVAASSLRWSAVTGALVG